MEEVASALDNSVIDEQKQVEYLNHACECSDLDCSLSSCQKMKRKVQHLKDCKERLNKACKSCRLFLSLCWEHAQNCQKAKCSVPFCLHFKLRTWVCQVQKLKQQTLMFNRHIATMQNGGIFNVVLQPSPKNSDSSIQQAMQQAQVLRSNLVAMQNSVLQPNLNSSASSLLSSLDSQTDAPQPGTSMNPIDLLPPGISMKPFDLLPPGTSMNPIDLLPAVQQVRATSKIPLMVNFCVNVEHLLIANYGENYPTIDAKTGLMASDK